MSRSRRGNPLLRALSRLISATVAAICALALILVALAVEGELRGHRALDRLARVVEGPDEGSWPQQMRLREVTACAAQFPVDQGAEAPDVEALGARIDEASAAGCALLALPPRVFGRIEVAGWGSDGIVGETEAQAAQATEASTEEAGGEREPTSLLPVPTAQRTPSLAPRRDVKAPALEALARRAASRGIVVVGSAWAVPLAAEGSGAPAGGPVAGRKGGAGADAAGAAGGRGGGSGADDAEAAGGQQRGSRADGAGVTAGRQGGAGVGEAGAAERAGVGPGAERDVTDVAVDGGTTSGTAPTGDRAACGEIAVVLDADTILAIAPRRTPWLDDGTAWIAGTGPEVAETSLGRLGVALGADTLRADTLALFRDTTAVGVVLLTALPAPDPPIPGLRFHTLDEWRALPSYYSDRLGVPVLGVQPTGAATLPLPIPGWPLELPAEHAGVSRVVDRRAATNAQADPGEPTLLTADVRLGPLGLPVDAPAFGPYLVERPLIYRGIEWWLARERGGAVWGWGGEEGESPPPPPP